MAYINNINIILETGLKIITLSGLGFFIFEYIKIRRIDNKIDSIQQEYYSRIDQLSFSVRYYIKQEEVEIKKDLIIKEMKNKIEPYQRKRDNIVSTIPFLK